ncbi:hypothetical protein ACFL6X_01170 [Candidatus Latescibacterota bacterium]
MSVGGGKSARLAAAAALLGTAAVLPSVAALAAGAGNVAPDAVSRATTWNEHAGQVAWLTDGLFPPEEAQAFTWLGKGTLAFEWAQVLSLDQVRVRLGESDGDFEVRTYIGGRRMDDGASRDPQGERTATVLDQSGTSQGWLVLDLPPETLADNLELVARGRAELYEVEILTAGGGTAVARLSWAGVKAARATPVR